MSEYSLVTNTPSHKKNICCVSGEYTENSLRLNEDSGYCKSSTTIHVKESLVEKKWIGDNLFVFINNQVFWEINRCDLDVIAPVRSPKEFQYLVHEEEYSIIKKCNFACDYK